MNSYKTEQENFWATNFGNEYILRNQDEKLISNNTVFFSKVLNNTQQINSVIELGSNIGLNLMALQRLKPNLSVSAVEINQEATKKLKDNIPSCEVHESSILDFKSSQKWDLVFTKGVLIHIHPDKLKDVYDLMYNCSDRYILIAEYYNPSPVEIEYRGHSNKLFKRDFAGDMLDQFKDLLLLDYGFVYRRDPNFPLDDTTWFLLEKKSTI